MDEEATKPKKKGKKKEAPPVPLEAVPDRVGVTMADRVSAWKTADSLLNRDWLREGEMTPRKWVTSTGDEEIVVGPHDVLILATWLLYGVVVED